MPPGIESQQELPDDIHEAEKAEVFQYYTRS